VECNATHRPHEAAHVVGGFRSAAPTLRESMNGEIDKAATMAPFGDIGADKPGYVQAMFTAIAGRYDFVNAVLSFGLDAGWRRFAASQATTGPNGLALDVAAGTGELARHLARKEGRATVVALDFCPDMLSRARAKRIAQDGGDRVEFVLGDVLQLPFADGTFDCVTIGFGLRNVADVRAAFREMSRVTRAGGTVVSLELTRPVSPFARVLHALWLSRVVPHLGRLISGSREAYEYLPHSIREFPSPEEVKIIMEGAGLGDVKVHRLSGGIATVHVGAKADGPGRPPQ